MNDLHAPEGEEKATQTEGQPAPAAPSTATQAGEQPQPVQPTEAAEDGLDVLEEQVFDLESPAVHDHDLNAADPLEQEIEAQVLRAHGTPGEEPGQPDPAPAEDPAGLPEPTPQDPPSIQDPGPADLPPAEPDPAPMQDPQPGGEIQAEGDPVVSEAVDAGPGLPVQEDPEPAVPETQEATAEPSEAVEDPAAAATPQEPATEPQQAPEQVQAQPAAQDDFLEEEVLPSTFQEPTLALNEHLQWGDLPFEVTAALPRGWFQAKGAAGEGLLVHMQPQALWGALQAHRIAPRALYSGAEGVIFPDVEGKVLTFPQPLPEALKVLGSLSQYVFSMYRQGYALIDLDPDGLLLTDEGLRLRFPPRLVRLGEPVTTVYREGFTAPEVMSGLAATGKEGVFFLGALLYRLMTGELLPAEGVTRTLLGRIDSPGIPQLLYQALQKASKRPDPEQWRSLLSRSRPTPTVEWKVVARSTVGLNPDRPVNEDSYAYRLGQVYSHHHCQTLLVACVSDGMGGMAAGEVASQAAVSRFLQVATPTNIEEAVWQSNQAVLDQLEGQDGGCTFSGVVAQDAQVVLGHVGDTRAYHFSGCVLKQISKDHSLVAALVASGMMTPEEAEHSPDRNKVLRSLGSIKQPQQDYVMQVSFSVAPGDRILLLSDGVWGEVGFEDLQGFMEMPLEQAAEAMIQASLASGAPDNATVLIAERIQ